MVKIDNAHSRRLCTKEELRSTLEDIIKNERKSLDEMRKTVGWDAEVETEWNKLIDELE